MRSSRTSGTNSTKPSTHYFREPVMNWIQRYIEAIRQHLPEKDRDDLAEEIESLLRDKIEAVEERLGHTLSESELLAVIEKNGEPREVAAAYRPSRALISAGVYPDYLRALKLSLGVVLLVMGALMVIRLDYSADHFALPRLIQDALHIGIELSHYALVVFAIVTLIYSGAETSGSGKSKQWNPSKILTKVRSKAYVAPSSSMLEIVLVMLFLALIHGFTPLPLFITHAGAEYRWEMSDAITATVPWLTLNMAGFVLLYLVNVARPYRDAARLIIDAMLNLVFVGLMIWCLTRTPLVLLHPADGSGTALADPDGLHMVLLLRVSMAVLIAIGLWDAWASLRCWRRQAEAAK